MLDADSLVDQAEHLVDIGRNDEAITLTGQALAQDPEHVRGLCTMARAQLHADRPEEALRCVDLALAAEPEGSFPAYLRAAILVSMRRWDAVPAAETAVRLDSQWWPAHGVYARALVLVGRKDMALQVAHHVVALAPDSAGAHHLLGEVATDVGRRDIAEREFRESLRLDPESVAARVGLAGVDLRRWRIRSVADQLLSVAPQDSSAAEVAGLLRHLVDLGFIVSLIGVGVSALVSLVALVVGSVGDGVALGWAQIITAIMALALAGAFGWLVTRVPKAAWPLVRSMLRTNGNRRIPIFAGIGTIALLVTFTATGWKAVLILLVLTAIPAFMMIDLVGDRRPDEDDGRPKTADDILY